jgi:predicted transposase YdaD
MFTKVLSDVLQDEELGFDKEKRTIAKNLLAKDSTPELVHSITGLSLEEISQLQV